MAIVVHLRANIGNKRPYGAFRARIFLDQLLPADAAEVAQRIRQIGAGRMPYGTDSALGDNLRPRDAWAALLRLPQSAREVAQIAGNVPPYRR